MFIMNCIYKTNNYNFFYIYYYERERFERVILCDFLFFNY